MKKALFNKGAGLRSRPWAAGTHLLLGAASTSSMTNAMQPSKPARRTLMTFLVPGAYSLVYLQWAGSEAERASTSPGCSLMAMDDVLPISKVCCGTKMVCLKSNYRPIHVYSWWSHMCVQAQACSAYYPNCRFSSIAWDAANLQCLQVN